MSLCAAAILFLSGRDAFNGAEMEQKDASCLCSVREGREASRRTGYGDRPLGLLSVVVVKMLSVEGDF